MSTEKHCPNCADQTSGRKTPHTHRDGKWKCGLCGHETAKRTYNSKKNRDMEDLIKNLQTEGVLKKIFGKNEKKKSRDEILRDRHRAMSDSELKAHAAELKSSIPSARAHGSLVGGAVRDTWQSAQNEIDRRARIKTIGEDAPANAVGGGNIAGMGVGSQGEPGVRPKALKRYKDKNAAEAPDPVMTTSPMRRSFKQFIKGK